MERGAVAPKEGGQRANAIAVHSSAGARIGASPPRRSRGSFDLRERYVGRLHGGVGPTVRLRDLLAVGGDSRRGPVLDLSGETTLEAGPSSSGPENVTRSQLASELNNHR